MFWLNIDVEIAKRPEFFGSPPLDRATWFCLMLFCAANENGGRIEGCRKWGARKWFSGCLVTLEEVQRETELWSWDADDLVVRFYPKDQEETVRHRRATGKDAADRRWGRNRSPNGLPIGSLNTEGKVKERNEMEGNGREGNIPAAFPPNLEEAVKLGADYEVDFVRKEWLDAAARGGCDWKMRPIYNWPIYLELQKEFRATRAGQPQTDQPSAPQGERLAPWRRLQLYENELTEVKESLERLPRFNPNIHPEEFQKKEGKAAPLRARRDELKRLIAEIQKQQQP